MDPMENQANVLYHASPVMFGARPFLFILFLLLCPLGIGFILLYGWHCKRKGISLIVDENKVSLETGKLSHSTIDIFHENLHSIQTRQSAMQRIFKIGEISIKATNIDDPVITVYNIPCPVKLKKLLEDRHQLATPVRAGIIPQEETHSQDFEES